MGYETNNIPFHIIHARVSSDYRCSSSLPMNVVVKSAHYDCKRDLCKDGVWLKMHGKHS